MLERGVGSAEVRVGRAGVVAIVEDLKLDGATVVFTVSFDGLEGVLAVGARFGKTRVRDTAAAGELEYETIISVARLRCFA